MTVDLKPIDAKAVDLLPVDLRGIPATGFVYGVKWDTASDNMATGVVSNGVFVEQDYTDYPIQEQMHRVLRKADGSSKKYLDADDSEKLADGSDATLDGTDGDVQVEIPRHYQLWVRDGDTQYILIGDGRFKFLGVEAWIPLCFRERSYYYHDAFEGVLYDDSEGSLVDGQDSTAEAADKTNDACRSLPGYKPWVYENRGQFRQLYANRGGSTHQGMWDAHQMIVALFVTEYGDWDSQAKLPGYTGAGSFDYAKVRETGRTMNLGNNSGSVTVDLDGEDSDLDGLVDSDQIIANSYRGIENIFGHIWKFLDGINIDNREGDCHVYTCTSPDDFADNVDDSAAGYVDTGHAPGFGDDDGYIVDIKGTGKHCPLYPDDISGGSSSTYLCDYHYNNSGAWRVPLVGGRLSQGGGAGLAALGASYDSGFRHSDFGSRGAAVSEN